MFCRETHVRKGRVNMGDYIGIDALARHLLEGSDTGAERPGGGIPPPNTSVSASVAIVIVISLVSVSLLITGIIIVAVTIDPSGGDDESDIEWDSPRVGRRAFDSLVMPRFMGLPT
ncbi:hypothetical protein GCK32_009538 [Trichostrongylus colubriformis]|uniref:Uncharacterized protein n=1 Tax=Trichostrongylus colubriformis TaxID=6319 RepID=A0AAN8IN30_TRICO